MAPITLFVSMLATASSAFGYTFTTCNAGCTGTGCGGEATSWTLGPASTQNIPGTQCIIWPPGGEAGSWDVCNRPNGGGSCTSGSNLNCFDAEDSSGRKICNTAGTQFIVYARARIHSFERDGLGKYLYRKDNASALILSAQVFSFKSWMPDF
ncbi:unnamed protein product [Penicillium pancosmium]